MYNENRCQTEKMKNSCGKRDARFGRHHHGKFTRHAHEMFETRFRRVPANIEETDDKFTIQVFAPALEKEYLKVLTKDDILTISYNPKEEPAESEKNFSRREYSNGAFERAFALNGKALVEQITAKYADGILTIILPKNPETNVPAKDISVN